MKPGIYLMKRRRAADLERADLARMLVPPIQRARLAEWLAQLERDEVHPADAILTALRGCFAFDVDIYRQLLDLHLGGELATDMLPHPRVCRVCACSFHDPCETDDGPCAWADDDADICSACTDGGDDDEPEQADQPVAANDIDSRAAA